MIKKEHYVYEHLNPETKEVFYVGVGKGDRVLAGTHRNKDWKRYVYKNNGYVFRKVVENIPKKDALKIERVLIKKYGIENLTNIVGEDGNSTAFKKGGIPWNKGLKGAQAPSTKKVKINKVEYDSVKQAISCLKISKTQFYRLIKQGKINVIYIHNRN